MISIAGYAFLLLAIVLLTATPLHASTRDGDEDTKFSGNFKPTRTVEYKDTGKKKLTIDIFEPAGHQKTDKRPAIVFYHGGGWLKGSPAQFHFYADYLAKRGMVAFSAQYRLTPEGVKVADCISDAKSAMRWVRAHAAELGIDPEKIVASGGSAGGHLAAATAIVPGLDEKNEDQKISAKPNLLALFNPALFHGRADKTIALEMFTKDTPPSIMMYGTDDKMLEYGTLCLKKSKEDGNPLQLFTAQGVGHGFFNGTPWDTQTAYLMDQFLAKHGYVKGEPTIELKGGLKLTEVK